LLHHCQSLSALLASRIVINCYFHRLDLSNLRYFISSLKRMQLTPVYAIYRRKPDRMIEGIKLRLISLFIVLFGSISVALSQTECDSIYGPTGEPAQGLDVPLCANDSAVVLVASSVGASYTWFDGSTASTNVVTATGNYGVTVSHPAVTGACTLNFNVFTAAVPPIVIQSDTTICPGQNATFDAIPSTYPFYTWNNGATTPSTTAGNPGNIWVLIADTNGCQNSDTVILQNFALDSIDLGPDSSFCEGDTVTLDAGPDYVTYLWTDLNSGLTSTNQTFAADTTGVYSVSATDTNGCDIPTSFIFLSMNSAPDATINGDDLICTGTSTQLRAPVGSLYTGWVWNTGDNVPIIIASAADTYWVEVTDTNGCTNTDTFNLNLIPRPPINLQDTTAICSGDSAILNAGPGMVQYDWSTGDTTQTIAISSQGSYSITIVDTNTCTNSDTTFLRVDTLPIVNLGPDINYCEGSTFSQLLDAGGNRDTILWMNGANTRLINVDTSTVNTVWVQVGDANGCVGSDTLFIIENLLPMVDLGPDTQYCANNSITLNAGNPGASIINYAWNTGDSLQTFTISGTPGILADTMETYSVTITDTNNCQNSDSISVTKWVLPRPELGNDTAYCYLDPFSMVLDPGPYAGYLWSTGETTSTITVGAIQSTYFVTVTDTRGCKNSDDMTVNENSLPNPNLGPDTNLCIGVSFIKILSPGGFISYFWSDSTTNAVLAVTEPGNYSVTVTDFNGCMNSDEMNVIAADNPPVDLGASVVFCEDVVLDTLLDASIGLPGGTGYSYFWNDNSTNSIKTVTDFGTYSVTVTDTTTLCKDSSLVQFTAFGKADPELGEGDLICPGEVMELDPEVLKDGYSYLWSTGETTSRIFVNQAGLYWVELNSENGLCTGIRDSIYFEQGVNPTVELREYIEPCIGQTVILLDDQTPFPNTTYVWQDGSTDFNYIVTESGTYSVTVTNECGQDEDRTTINYYDCFTIYVPTAFSPNGDGKNDIFLPKSAQEFTDYNLTIFDRWGSLVFETNDINQGWDGKQGVTDADGEVYIWKISYISAFDENLQRREELGQVVLIR
jgi:gliding motility-associated-like protein